MRLERFNFGNLMDFRSPEEILLQSILQETPQAEEEQPEANLPPPPPTFSEEELKKAEAAAYEKGKADGIKAGLAQADTEARRTQKSTEAAAQIAARQFITLASQHQEFLNGRTAELSELVLVICDKLAGDLISSFPAGTIESTVQSCLHILVEQPKVTVHVHSALVSVLPPILLAQLNGAGFEGELVVLPDHNVALGDCRVEWENGTAQRNTAQLWERVQDLLDQMSFALGVSVEPEPITESAYQPVSQEGASVSASAPKAAESDLKIMPGSQPNSTFDEV